MKRRSFVKNTAVNTSSTILFCGLINTRGHAEETIDEIIFDADYNLTTGPSVIGEPSTGTPQVTTPGTPEISNTPDVPKIVSAPPDPNAPTPAPRRLRIRFRIKAPVGDTTKTKEATLYIKFRQIANNVGCVRDGWAVVNASNADKKVTFAVPNAANFQNTNKDIQFPPIDIPTDACCFQYAVLFEGDKEAGKIGLQGLKTVNE